MTNIEKIKSMSNEDMGKWIWEIMTEDTALCWKCPVSWPFCRKRDYSSEDYEDCLNIIIKWLGDEECIE